ncbi:MAG: hypothetical protein H6707_09190 [Deltaproteobacteria bacterium]|nr:hypothetical protein [Deltaproteobacteria bacterium]
MTVLLSSGLARAEPRSTELGVRSDAKGTRFSVFAPKASQVELLLGKRRFPMVLRGRGVFETLVPVGKTALEDQRYSYRVTDKNKRACLISDPYAEATTADERTTSRVANLTYNWNDRGFRRPPAHRLVISELHVKDVTQLAPDIPVSDRGTFVGMTHRSVVDYYKSLGTAIQLLPLQSYDSKQGGHWGYMPEHYFALKERYAKVQGRAHRELMGLVDRYHQEGIPVLMDVVYNHTANGEDLHFRVLGHDYFYRLKGDGTDRNGAGCGNELATERPMVRRLLLDSLKHFVEKFHIDGFRFDLAALLDMDTMRAIDRTLPKDVYLIAEPWAASRALWSKKDLIHKLKSTRWMVWNDTFRQSVRSFVTGASDGETRNKLIASIAGNTRPSGWRVSDTHFTARPNQSVPYVDSHDEQALADVVGGNAQRQFLATVLLLTSQGVPMLGQGQELMRSKAGRRDTYKDDNPTNWLDWTMTEQKRRLSQAVGQLVALRKSLPFFDGSEPLTDRDITWIRDGLPDQALGYHYHQAGQELIVLANGHKSDNVTVPLPSGNWKVVADGELLAVDANGLRTASKDYRLAPGCAVVLSR